MQKYIHELFEEVCKLENREERISYLKEHAFKQVKTVLQLCYNDKIELDLPYGRPPFETCPEGREPSPIANVFSSIGVCVKNNDVARVKKEKIFIGILEQFNRRAHVGLVASDGKRSQQQRAAQQRQRRHQPRRQGKQKRYRISHP